MSPAWSLGGLEPLNLIAAIAEWARLNPNKFLLSYKSLAFASHLNLILAF